LKEDEDGDKTTTVNGIRAACKIMKTRYAKPFESVQVKIPYETGMNPYSGLTDLIEGKELLKKEAHNREQVLQVFLFSQKYYLHNVEVYLLMTQVS
jgi:hypothetical protein